MEDNKNKVVFILSELKDSTESLSFSFSLNKFCEKHSISKNFRKVIYRLKLFSNSEKKWIGPDVNDELAYKFMYELNKLESIEKKGKKKKTIYDIIKKKSISENDIYVVFDGIVVTFVNKDLYTKCIAVGNGMFMIKILHLK